MEKQEKQEVEIKQRMTVSDLAQAMNKDIGMTCLREHIFDNTK